MERKLGILLTVLLIASCVAKAQEKPRLAMLSKAGKDCVELRWAPLDFDAWQFGNANGYIVERSTILRKGKLVDPVERKVLTVTPLQLADRQEWAKYEDDKYAMIAGECILGEYEEDSAAASFLPAKAYRKKKDNERRIGFALYSADMSVNAAKLSALYFKDTEAKAEEKYLYKVYFANQDSTVHDTATTFVGIQDYQPLYRPERPYSYCDQKTITIWWQNSSYSKYSNYYIEKSSDNGKTFSRVVDMPISTNSERTFFADTLVSIGNSYQYRLVGIDSFGEESPESEAVTVRMSPLFEKDPDFTNIETVNNSSVVLTWYYKTEAEIKGFKIYRSKSSKGKKTLIYRGTDADQRTYTDNSPMYDNYYFLSVYNDNEERLNPFPFYAQLIDSIPPTPPEKPFGYCDSLGYVHLVWNRHPDEDVHGYRLFRSNSGDKNFMMCSHNQIADTFYVDTVTLNTLSKKVYYKLNAVDGRGNQSDMSEMCAVSRYDTIRPASPKINEISYQKDGVLITFYPSPSKDVEKYIIYRKLADDKEYEPIDTTDATKAEYLDNSVSEGERYHYGIQAVDDYGLRSDMVKRPFSVPAGKAPVVELKKKIDSKVVTFTWTSNGKKEPKYAVVYRKVNDEPLMTYYETQSHTFTDSQFVLGNTYIYRVRVIYTDGTESTLSNEVKIKF